MTIWLILAVAWGFLAVLLGSLWAIIGWRINSAKTQQRYVLILPDSKGGSFIAPGEYVLEGEYWYRVDVSPRVRIEAWPLTWRPM